MCGFDDDWRCPNHKMRDRTEMAYCPEGGCSLGCCARDRQDEIGRLTGTRPALSEVHVS